MYVNFIERCLSFVFERFLCLYFEMGAPTLFISCLISYVLVILFSKVVSPAAGVL